MGSGAGTAIARSPGERRAAGKAARAEAKRSSHADWIPAPDRTPPVEVLERQDAARVPELVPIRHGRMLSSPFAFFRGGAAIMAADLAGCPRSGLRAQLCGDAHLSNFGVFAAPDRTLVFDVNDFDETLPGPFEWDVKRLAASLTIAGRAQGFEERERRRVTLAAVLAYRVAMRRFAGMRNLDVWYARMNVEAMLARWASKVSRRERKAFDAGVRKAEHKDSLRALAKLSRRVDGERRIVSDPPLIVPIEELVDDVERARLEEAVDGLLSAYRETLGSARRRLMEGYRYAHFARKVVGVGSVGTRAWIVLLIGRDESDPLFLQVKEAQASVLEPFAGRSEFDHQGQRVVEGQRLMQAAGDPLLGWVRAVGPDGHRRDHYVRQLWDWKRSAEIERMAPKDMTAYGELCGWTLARAHARSGDRVAIAAYLGSGRVFDEALANFGEAYADQNERDYAEFAEAVESGRVSVESGL
ncbi:MAG: DUF2252 domain-containing protein [Solirubrobacterales bacterium]